MKKTSSPFNLSIRWMGLFGMLCLWASCSLPRLAQNALSPDNHITMAPADEVPQAAQTKSASAKLLWSAQEGELIASNDLTMLPAVSETLDASLADLAFENPKLARKMSKVVYKLEKQVAVNSDNPQVQASAKNKHAAGKLIAKAEKQFDIMKAKKADAAQANATLVGLGALVAIVGLVLLVATSGTTATVGLIALVVGIVLLIISLLAN